MSPQTPVIVGVGQIVDHWNGMSAADAPSPLSLAVQAVLAALADTGAASCVSGAADHVVFVRTMLDSVPRARQPFGRCANLPGTLAKHLGMNPAHTIFSVVGGDQPQALVNEFADAIFSGNADIVVLAGAEATAAMKLALKRGISLDWSDSVPDECTDRGLGPALLTQYEAANGLGAPTQTYPAFEHALRARHGVSREAHLALMSELWAGFSRVAAANVHAQFPTERTAAYLSTPTSENYDIADPYLKWHVAQDSVNQGAAVILTSVARAITLGIDPAKWVFLHGYAQAADTTPSARPDLSRSRAIELAIAHAMTSAGKMTSDIRYFDLYSCFPCAVLLAAEALGLNWRATDATVTGGLPFFGGAGNNYSMHAIVTMADRLRAAPDDFGLVLANGGFLSKEAVGVYSAQPKHDWHPVSSRDIQSRINAAAAPVLLSEPCNAVIETYTVTTAKGELQHGYIVGRSGKARIIARVRAGDTATLHILKAEDVVGRDVQITHDNGTNYVTLTQGV